MIISEIEILIINYGEFFLIGAVGILFLVMIFVIASRINEKTGAASFEEISGSKEIEEYQTINKKSKGMLGIEEMLYSIINVDPGSNVISAVRILAMIASVIAAFKLKFLAIYFVFEVYMYLYSMIKEKQVEDENGLTYIDRTNKFLDLYIPSVSNGQAVSQVMNRFVEMESDEDLTRWWYMEDEDKLENIPSSWEQVIRVYLNGVYNEAQGFQDSADSFQQDLITQITYYNNFKEKIGEVAPTRATYYIFMPIILLISHSNSPDFWGSFPGLLNIIFLCILLWIFSFLMGKVHKDSCDKLF